MMDKFNVCVDFDGVLNNYTGWKGEDDLSTPREGAKEFLEKLGNNFKIIIFTTRDTNKVEKWMQDNNMPYDSVTNTKVGAMAYVDDRAVKFRGDFDSTLIELEKFHTYWELKEENTDNYQRALSQLCYEYHDVYNSEIKDNTWISRLNRIEGNMLDVLLNKLE